MDNKPDKGRVELLTQLGELERAIIPLKEWMRKYSFGPHDTILVAIDRVTVNRETMSAPIDIYEE